jgi:hypothetical protein
MPTGSPSKRGSPSKGARNPLAQQDALALQPQPGGAPSAAKAAEETSIFPASMFGSFYEPKKDVKSPPKAAAAADPPAPSPVKTPTQSPEKPSSPTPVPVPVPVPVPTARASPAPSPVKTPTQSPEKTSSPAPVLVPTPSPVKRPTQSPKKTSSPAPVPVPAPSPVKTPIQSPEKPSSPTPVPVPVPVPVPKARASPEKATESPLETKSPLKKDPSPEKTASPEKEESGGLVEADPVQTQEEMREEAEQEAEEVLLEDVPRAQEVEPQQNQKNRDTPPQQPPKRNACLIFSAILCVLAGISLVAILVPRALDDDNAIQTTGGDNPVAPTPAPTFAELVTPFECEEAVVVGANSTTAGTTKGAPALPEIPVCSGLGANGFGVWFQLEGDGNVYKASTCDPSTDFDTQISIFSGSCSKLECVAANDQGSDDSCGSQSQLEFSTNPGDIYYLFVHGKREAEGQVVLNMEQVSQDNDLCDKAGTVTPSGGDEIIGNTWIAATGGNGDNFTCSESTVPGLWYAIQGEGKAITISTCSESTKYNADISVAAGSSCSDLTCVETTSEECIASLQGTIKSFFASADTVYNVLIHGSDAAQASVESSRQLQDGSDPADSQFGMIVQDDVGPSGFFVDVQEACALSGAIEIDELAASSVLYQTSNSLWDSFCDGSGQGEFYQIIGQGRAVTANTCNNETDIDTTLSVVVGDCVNQIWSCVASNDQFCGDQSSVKWFADLGETYYLLVRSTGSNHGSYALTVSTSATQAPTAGPSENPSSSPTTPLPTQLPSASPSAFPTMTPSVSSSSSPTSSPSFTPTSTLSLTPTASPTQTASANPTGLLPTTAPPTKAPTNAPITPLPTASATTNAPIANPTVNPTPQPTPGPTTANPTANPTPQPTPGPTTAKPTVNPTPQPTPGPTKAPTARPTVNPTPQPTPGPTKAPTARPTVNPTPNPTPAPIGSPTATPSSSPTYIIDPTELCSDAPARDALGSSDSVAIIGRGPDFIFSPDLVGSCGTSSYNNSPAIWYKLDGTRTGLNIIASAEVCNTMFDLQLTVFRGDCDQLTCVAGSSDFCNQAVRFEWGTGSNTYYLMFHGFGTMDGNFVFNVDS